MFKLIENRIRLAQFYPGFLGLFVNPFYFARKGLLKQIASLGKEIRGKTLDVGCGQKPYQKLFNSSQYVGLELDTPENRSSRKKKPDIFYDGNTFPFQDCEFDSMVINQVLEHVFTPNEFFHEVFRVLKPGGTLLISVPFLWDEHEQPYDYARYTSFGIRSLLERNGFEVVQQRKTIDDARTLFQLLNAYIYKKTVTPFPVLNVLFTVLFMMPWNIIGEFAALILPRNKDLYLDNVILARKATHA